MSVPTPSQTRAIQAQGNVLVMAGAGTGKTRTLVERCLAWLRDPVHPGSLDHLLMVTFTEAAAAEMRKRIRARLEAESAAAPEDLALREQLALLDTARIQTLHSFCLELVRQHFLELGIDPQFRVLDEGQSGLLARETFDRILEAHLSADTPAATGVRELIHDRGRGWDKPVRELVFKVHAYLRSLRDPQAWLERQSALFLAEHPHAWLEALSEGFAAWRAFWGPILGAQPPEGKVPARAAELLVALGPAPDRSRSAEAVLEILADDERPDWPRGTKGKLRPPVKRFFDEAAFWATILPVRNDVDPVQEDWGWVRTHMTALLALVREFATAFGSARQQQGAVDFADLEQFALALLQERTAGSQGWTPSPIAREWQARLDRVFVDEYQDINEAQDAILSAVARTGADSNRFLVGDVKQSIYRFRLADPRIFQRYASAWSAEDGAGGGVVIPLSDNFRSHEGILAFVNQVFTDLMQPEVGGVAYDEAARLRFGAPASRPQLALAAELPAGRRVELHVRLTGGEEADREEPAGETEEAVDVIAERENAEHEARLIGLRLQELKADPHGLWDASLNSRRAPEWSEMVVLLRAPRGRAEVYAREFARLGIPLTAARSGFLEAIEVSDLVNLLRLLDNPLQDVPLLAVLRSPLVGLSLEALANIRLAAPKTHFWTALLRWQETAEPKDATTTRTRLAQFLERHARWRALSRQGALSECLEAVLDETHYADWCLAQDRGRQRQANVQKLLSLTRQFDPLQRQGLFRFLRHLEALEEAGIETEPAAVDGDNAVRLMSVHQSKGLEAPIVVVADLGRRFNQLDSTADVILDEHLGLCPRIKPPHTAQRYPSLTHWLAARRQRRESLGEELRLLYVAMTRAEQRLILVGTAAASAPEGRWRSMSAMPVAAQRVQAAGCWLDWLGPVLPASTGSETWWQEPSGVGPDLKWTRYEHADPRLELPDRIGEQSAPLGDRPSPPLSSLPEPGAGIEDEDEGRGRQRSQGVAPTAFPCPTPGELAALDALALRLRWRYSHDQATREPAKTSVSALRHRQTAESNEEAKPARFIRTNEFGQIRPVAGLSAAEIGIAHHVFLQRVALDRTSSEAELRAEADRLLTAGELAEAEKGALDLGALLAFWQSEVGLLLRTQAPFVQREMPFTLRVQHTDLEHLGLSPQSDLLDDEFVVVQGVVDLAVLREREIWLLDFKTDALQPGELPDRVAFHTPQIRLYALALERIFGRPVTRRWLHFLAVRETVSVADA